MTTTATTSPGTTPAQKPLFMKPPSPPDDASGTLGCTGGGAESSDGGALGLESCRALALPEAPSVALDMSGVGAGATATPLTGEDPPESIKLRGGSPASSPKAAGAGAGAGAARRVSYRYALA